MNAPGIPESNFVGMSQEGIFKTSPGGILSETIHEATQLARVISADSSAVSQLLRRITNQPQKGDFVLTFVHDGVTLKVGRYTDEAALLREWQRARDGQLGQNPVIGP